MLQANRNGDGEIVHQRAEGRTFLVHVDEDLADFAVLIFTGVEIDLMASDSCLLDITLTAIRQLAAYPVAFDDPLDNALADDGFGLWRGAAWSLAPGGLIFEIR